MISRSVVNVLFGLRLVISSEKTSVFFYGYFRLLLADIKNSNVLECTTNKCMLTLLDTHVTSIPLHYTIEHDLGHPDNGMVTEIILTAHSGASTTVRYRRTGENL